MLGQRGIQRHSLGPQSIPLFIFCDNSDGIEGLGPNLDGDLRVRDQIVIPVRVSECASGGGEHDQAVALGHISHWSRAALAALGPSRREQEQGCAFPHSTNFAPICLELLNQAAIEEFQANGDRKSTRLNSSHGYISYAVFCLKKKKTCKKLREIDTLLTWSPDNKRGMGRPGPRRQVSMLLSDNSRSISEHLLSVLKNLSDMRS